jgi:hypothetical protein
MSEEKEGVKAVWLVEAIYPYEGSTIVGVYASEDLAFKKKARIEASQRRYAREMERFNAITDGLGDDDQWPEWPNPCEYSGHDISVTKFRLIRNEPPPNPHTPNN